MRKVIAKVYCDLYDSDHDQLHYFEIMHDKTVLVVRSSVMMFYSFSNFENEFRVNLADVLTDLKIVL